MLNKVLMMGRLTADPTLRRTGSGVAVASFTIACDDDFKDKDGNKKTIFVECVAWRQTGEYVSKYFSKGRMAIVVGKLDIREWTDKDGNKRRTAEIVADNVYFGDSKKNDTQSQNTGNTGFAKPESSQNSFAVIEDDDAQLPF
jgi:single-strand DNA-binding protein